MVDKPYVGGVKHPPGPNRFIKYNLYWPIVTDPVFLEMEMVRHGGRWKKQDGELAGEGMEFHFKRGMSLLWPHIVWHPWAETQLKCYLNYRIIGQIGSASSGKSFVPAACALFDYYCYPNCTTVMVSSTTRESLEMRVWGEIKSLHRKATEANPWLSGHLIEGKQRIVSDARDEAKEGRDFRNGLCAVACRKGQTFQGIEEMCGVKNKRIRLLADECFVDGTLVDTPLGGVPIEDIEPGDVVMSAVGPSKVLATSCRWSDLIFKINTAGGRAIKCTPNHQFLTQVGWKKACELNETHYLLSQYEAMRILRQTAHSKAETFLQSVLQREVDALPAGYQQEEAGESFARAYAGAPQQSWMGKEAVAWHDGQQPHEGSGDSAEGVEGAPGYGAQASDSWREWDRANKSGECFAGQLSRREVELSYKNWEVERQRIPHGLQGGHSVPGQENSHRGRRQLTHELGQSEGQGPEEGQVPVRDRVVGVEVLQSANPESNRGHHSPHRVHNLQVEGHPSYSVEGLLVHNCQFMPRSFVGSISNLNKNKDFKCVGSGNPKETTDALGVLCEPAAHLGGWDGGIDQTPESKTWEIRFPQGICIQFCGTDSPNLDGKMGIPLITQEQINSDIAFYGKDSIQYSMMDMGMMPRGQGNRRVITRNLCLKFGAMEEPYWLNSQQTRVGFLDASYRGVGGDRCVFGELRFGLNSERKEIMALIDTMVIPIKDGVNEMPEDQIAQQVREQCENRMIEPDHVFFDSTGRGSLMSAFARLWSPHVVPIEFGATCSDRPVSTGIDATCREYYSKFVTELWYSVRLVVECGQFRGMTEEMMLEGCMREWTFVAGHKIEVEPKDKMKLKSGRSPDLFDALAAGVEGARRLGFVIEKITDRRPNPRENAWKREVRDRANSLWRDHDLSYA